MAPTPQEYTAHKQTEEARPVAADGDSVVISGMAGLFPQARYVKDLENILYNKLNPVCSDTIRWEYNHPEVVQYTGNIPGLDLFDAQFFKVHYKLGKTMDAMARKMLEQAYEAIYDAGVNPGLLSGKKVGVYIGTSLSETEKSGFYDSRNTSGFGIAGCNKSMFANRISYWLNVKGPSMSIDQACCSSLAALEAAYEAVARGECEAAVVGGANLCLHPQSSMHYGRVIDLSVDGKTKSFSEDATGCARSETVNVLFLQKAKNAKRIYVHVMHAKSEFVSLLNGETGPKYGFYRNPADTAKFLTSFYDVAGISPAAVEYIEAFGSALPEADKSELEAIEKVFCSEREEPLLVGSVMSNIGYAEAASGLSAVTKVVLGYHKGLLAGNLHCTRPRQDVRALREGRMRVLTDHHPFRRSYAAVNGMSVTGVNAHVLLGGYYKHKDFNRYKTNIPRLVTISGRHEPAVKRALNLLKSHPIDPEELALLYNIHETNIAGHLGKGYTILDTNSEGATVSLSQHEENFDGTLRPLWFVYSGMGSQWAGMGTQLMRIPIFAAAIERCRKVLEPKGIDIVHIITSPDKTIFDNILHSFVGIAAVQIGLTDILLQLGLVPDKVIGHSVGELGCAYADGCLTAEEMILSAYSRGRVSLETPFIRGSMAAVGVGAQQMSTMCPPEIEIACHNSAESCTISGPAEAMRTFVADLTARGIFAKEVPCSNIAYHSRYIQEAGPGLLKYLKEVITTPKVRSERWVSSSVPRDRWEEPAAKYSSAEYHTNNLLSPVLFEEASTLVPSDAVLVEVAPHALLQAILKRSLPASVTNIPLTRRGHSDNVVLLLDAIGKLYLHGFNPKVQKLYPEVEFPVSTGTPFLSHYVQWAHQEQWPFPLYMTARRTMTASCTFMTSVHGDHCYLKGNVIGNKMLLPFSFALVAAWDTLAMSLDVPKKSLRVVFSQVKLYAQPILHDQKTVRLSVQLHRGSGRFEIMDENSKVASGFITHKESSKTQVISDSANVLLPKSGNYEISAEDVYRVLYERGYSYSGMFRSIHSTNSIVSEAKLLWNDNWVVFLDGLFQLNALNTQSGVIQPDWIRRIVIDPIKHLNSKTYDDIEKNTTSLIDVILSDVKDQTSSGGVIIEGLRFHNVHHISNDKITLETLKFVPRFDSKFDIFTSLYVLLQIVAENMNEDHINVIGISDDQTEVFKEIERIAKKGIPGTKIHYRHMSIDTAIKQNEQVYENVNLILVRNLSKTENISQRLHRLLQRNTFIINEEDITAGATETFPMNFYNVVSVLKNAKTQLELARWRSNPQPITSALTVHSESDLSLLKHTRNNCSYHNSFLVLASYPPAAGLIGLVKQWRREPTRNRIHVVMTNESSKENFGVEEFPDLNLAYNIFDNGTWGGEYYLPIVKTSVFKNPVTLRSAAVGNLHSLEWVQMPALTGTGTLVRVHYAGINMGDVKQVLGLAAPNTYNGFGMDFSGVTQRGERIMGLVPNGAASSYVMVQQELSWPVPEFWTLEDAATVPLAYVYAYYCLVVKKARRLIIQSMTQYTVLVHGGAGAFGQAAISIALARGWRVFTTVSDLDKKHFLMRLYPQLNEEDIGSSRDANFGDVVLNATQGNGCNLVICCLKGELKNASLKCSSRSGILIDTTQNVCNENFSFGMYHLTKERSYLAVDIMSIFGDPKSKEIAVLHNLMTEGIASGEVRPLTRITFAPHEAARAFRLVAESRHRGRALLRLGDEPAPSLPRYNPEKSCHIVVCGSNPHAISLADKILIESGTKNLHLHVNASTGPLKYKLQAWKKKNVQVAVTYGGFEHTINVSELLHSAAKLGPVESIHILADNVLQERVIQILDQGTRTLCPNLKNFVVLSNDSYLGHYTCVRRAKSGLPATLLNLSLLETEAEGGARYRGFSDAVQQAWESADTVLLARPKHAPRLSLLQHLAVLTGLDINNDTTNSVTLEHLGLPVEKYSSVYVFLKDVYNICVDEENIPQLTTKRLQQIEESTHEMQLEEMKGLETFFSFVDSDELLATTKMVFMPTLTNNDIMRDDEIGVSQTYLCIVPGLEGLHARFRTLCEHLKLQAVVLQPGLDYPTDTPAQLARRYAETLLTKTGIKNTFYILGYETGVLVALELAAILEERGLVGTVFCLGDGPLEMQVLLRAHLSGLESEEALQCEVARHMFTLICGGSSTAPPLASAGSWGARLDTCVHALLGRVSHSAQYARGLLEAAHARIGAALLAEPAPRALRSRIVLLRARDTAGDACSLQSWSSDPLALEQLATPMAHAAHDLRVPAIINSYLDQQILEAFEKKNLCDTYLMNANLFMMASV